MIYFKMSKPSISLARIQRWCEMKAGPKKICTGVIDENGMSKDIKMIYTNTNLIQGIIKNKEMLCMAYIGLINIRVAGTSAQRVVDDIKSHNGYI